MEFLQLISLGSCCKSSCGLICTVSPSKVTVRVVVGVTACDVFNGIVKTFMQTMACKMLLPISTALYAFTEEIDVMPISIFINSVPSQIGCL